LPCPSCRGCLTNKRSLLGEKLVRKLPKICCKFEGCTFERTALELVIQHEEMSCLHRLIPCAYCDHGIALNTYIDHMKTIHSTNTVKFAGFNKTMELNMKISNTPWDELVIEVEKDIPTIPQADFMLHWIKADVSCFYFWISCAGPKNSVKEYNFTIQVYNKEMRKNGNPVWIFQGYRQCVPFDLSHDDMKARKHCLMLDKDLIEEAVKGKDEGYLRLRLTIHGP